MKFSDTRIDSNEIRQELLNIENKTRTNLFTWNGQFSPQFVEIMLETYCKENHVLLDPFVGSGTVLIESARRNLAAVGIELNPSAYHLAKIYELCTIEIQQRQKLLEECNDIIVRINDDIDIESRYIELVNSITNEKEKIIFYCLTVCIDLYHNKLTKTILIKKWEKLKKIILEIPYTEKELKVYLGDSRKVPLSESSIDVVLTSPPYINVFNYHQNYRKSVESIGYNVLDIAKTEIGSNRKFRGNRLYTVVQYCIDMAMIFDELTKVTKPNARIIFIVGRESNVLGYRFYNSEIIFDICNKIFKYDFLIRQERVFTNRFGKKIYEDILHFQNTKTMMSTEEILLKAREIAKEKLEEKRSEVNKNVNYLLMTINNIENIQPSEVKTK